MSFVIDPVSVVTTLHSLVEQKNSRITFLQAVHELAAKGLVLPGKTEKEQVQVLTALINLCSSDFLDARPGRSGGVGLPSMRADKLSKPARAKKTRLASLMHDAQASHDAESEEETDLTGT